MKVSLNRLETIQTKCMTSQPGTSPFPQNYDYVEGQSNPYLCRYGELLWLSKIRQVCSSGLTSVICIKELITHIEAETKRAYAGTAYADTYRWSHDALKQMCDAKCKAWMKELNIWHRWVKSELGLNDKIVVLGAAGGIKSSCRYKDRPVGDQPELMPLDASLNHDIDCSYDWHVMLTAHLPADDPRKFRKDTPKEISRAIMRLCHPTDGVVPNSRRIVEDIKRVLISLEKIVEAGGAIVPGIVNRNGHRNKPGCGGGRQYFPRKENQTCKTLEDMDIYPCVQRIAREFTLEERAKWENKQSLLN
jgi:hypothetical protein